MVSYYKNKTSSEKIVWFVAGIIGNIGFRNVGFAGLEMILTKALRTKCPVKKYQVDKMISIKKSK